MPLTRQQTSTAQAIINIFETGSIRGDYANVTLLRGDSGQLTYGRSQTTLASGNLYLLIDAYSRRADGAYSKRFVRYLPRVEACDTTLNHDTGFRQLLGDAGQDPVMHEVQDAFFDRVYWDPAVRSADAVGITTPLGCALVYDSTVHGSWATVRDLTRRKFGELGAIGEKKWVARYIDVRRNWLATHGKPILHKTVYRMDAFKAIVGADNWDLTLPFVVRGMTITAASLDVTAPVRATAGSDPQRILRLRVPPMSGADVVWLQQHLARAAIPVAASGAFDAQTDAAVRRLQSSHQLKPDGIVGTVTRTVLEDVSVLSPVNLSVAEGPMPSMRPVLPAPEQTAPVPAVPRLDSAGTASPAAAPKDPTKNERVSLVRWLAAAAASLIVFLASRLADVRALLARPSGLFPEARPPGQALQFLSDVQARLHAFAASVPAVWDFRLRVIGLVLLFVVLQWLFLRRLRLRRLRRDIGGMLALRISTSTALQLADTSASTPGQIIMATALSVLVLAASQIGQGLSWLATADGAAALHGRAGLLSKADVGLRRFAEAIPYPWPDRLGIAGAVMLFLVLYFLVARSFDLKKLESEIARAVASHR